MDKSKVLNEALKMLGMISLKGDAVDVMAAAKGNIRAVIAQIKDDEELMKSDSFDREVKNDG